MDATKSGTGLKKTSAGDPSVSVHEFAVPSDWLAMSPDEQFKLWTQGTGPKLPGVDPRQFNLQGLFTPHHGIQNIPFIFVNFDGQPFGEAKRPEASFVGSRSAPVSTLPDFLQGLYIPLVKHVSHDEGTQRSLACNNQPDRGKSGIISPLLCVVFRCGPRFIFQEVELLKPSLVQQENGRIFRTAIRI